MPPGIVYSNIQHCLCRIPEPRYCNRTYPQYVSQVSIPYCFHTAHFHSSCMNAMMSDSTSWGIVCSICAYSTGRTCHQQFRSYDLQHTPHKKTRIGHHGKSELCPCQGKHPNKSPSPYHLNEPDLHTYWTDSREYRQHGYCRNHNHHHSIHNSETPISVFDVHEQQTVLI